MLKLAGVFSRYCFKSCGAKRTLFDGVVNWAKQAPSIFHKRLRLSCKQNPIAEYLSTVIAS